LKNGFYVDPHYVALLEIINYKPIRCTGLYSYQESSTDVFELFITRSALTYDALLKGNGKIIADHRYVPYVARTRVIELLRRAVDIFGGMVIIGRRDYELGLRCREGYVGILATGGELILTTLAELGILIYSKTANAIISFNELEPVCDVGGEVIVL